MAVVVAQLTDVHIGGPIAACGERFSAAVDAVNAMERQPDLVLLTGDLTDTGTPAQWQELTDRASALRAPWEAIRGNHDVAVPVHQGHRSMDVGPLHVLLLDSSSEVFGETDAAWVDADLSAHADRPTLVALHHPPFETGVWWMDCLGLRGGEVLEAVVRRHPQVHLLVAGHVHRPICSSWGTCRLWVAPATAAQIAPDLARGHDPAETAEPPMVSLHAWTGTSFVSHVVPVGDTAVRDSLSRRASEFVDWVRGVDIGRRSSF